MKDTKEVVFAYTNTLGSIPELMTQDRIMATAEGYTEIARLAGTVGKRVVRAVVEPWIDDRTPEAAKAIDEMAMSIQIGMKI